MRLVPDRLLDRGQWRHVGHRSPISRRLLVLPVLDSLSLVHHPVHACLNARAAAEHDGALVRCSCRGLCSCRILLCGWKHHRVPGPDPEHAGGRIKAILERSPLLETKPGSDGAVCSHPEVLGACVAEAVPSGLCIRDKALLLAVGAALQRAPAFHVGATPFCTSSLRTLAGQVLCDHDPAGQHGDLQEAPGAGRLALLPGRGRHTHVLCGPGSIAVHPGGHGQ
mmetsp:Transcript_16910/g.48282  ORF Transcript_16910/g.48282 Transcript_16910/m.48282 type:complete len:224 (+) Transcript_16910:1371-2042(+)